MAFEGLLKGSLMFSEDQLQNFCSADISQKKCTLGLLTAFKFCDSSGVLTKYQFTHLTVQEYLAAEYLAKQSEKMQTEFIIEHIANERFLVILQFLFGITSRHGTITDLSGLFGLLCSPEDPRRLQVLLRLTYETRQEDCLKVLGSRINGKTLMVHTEHWSGYELQLLAYLIDCLQWNYSKLNTWGVSGAMNISVIRHHTLCISHLIRQQCITEIEIVTDLELLYKVLLNHLYNERFNLSGFEMQGQGNHFNGRFRFVRQSSIRGSSTMREAMAALLECPKLMDPTQADKGFSLFLSQGHCPHTVSIANLQPAINWIQTGRNDLSANITSVLQCIASGLEILRLGGHLIFPNEAAVLFGAAAASMDLKVLDLSNNLLFQGHFRHRAIEAFQYMLSRNKSLEELGMKECELDEEVLSIFAVHNSSIKVLNLDCTHKFPTSVDLQLLTRNLSTLYLCHSYLNDEDATRIGSMLCSNGSLKELYLDRNNITAGGAICIFRDLTENTKLQYLSMGRQTKTKSDNETNDGELQDAFIKTTAAMFQQNKTLKRLSVPIFASHGDKKVVELKIHDKNTKEYIKKAHEVKCRQYNFECVNGQASGTLVPVVMLPAEEFLSLVKCSVLEELDLSGYDLTEPSTMLSLIDFIKQNSSMTHLKLFTCRLHEIQCAPLQKQLLHALCNNQALTDLSVDPKAASLLASFVDKVNYERHTMRIQPLTIHTDKDFYELVMRTWNHA